MMDDQPVTRAELIAALAATKLELKAELMSELTEVIDKRLEKTETALLKAFFAYQEHAEIRFRKMAADVSNINSASDLRLNNLEQRVIEIERKLLLHPPAA